VSERDYDGPPTGSDLDQALVEVSKQRDQLLEGIEEIAERVTPSRLRDELHALVDRIKSKGEDDDVVTGRGGSDQVDGVAPEPTSEDSVEQAVEGFRCATDAHDFKTYREVVALVASILAVTEDQKLRELLEWLAPLEQSAEAEAGYHTDEGYCSYCEGQASMVRAVIGHIQSSLSSEAGS
jgi:hypothetical protein